MAHIPNIVLNSTQLIDQLPYQDFISTIGIVREEYLDLLGVYTKRAVRERQREPCFRTDVQIGRRSRTGLNSSSSLCMKSDIIYHKDWIHNHFLNNLILLTDKITYTWYLKNSIKNNCWHYLINNQSVLFLRSSLLLRVVSSNFLVVCNLLLVGLFVTEDVANTTTIRVCKLT